MFYPLTLGMVAQQVGYSFKRPDCVKFPLPILDDVYERLIEGGAMNWGRLFFSIRYAECFNLQRREWNTLLDFIESKQPLAPPTF